MGGGRPSGAKNKTTREREEIARREMEARKERQTVLAMRPLAKERLEELADVCVGNAAKHQPGKEDYNEEKYRYWLRMYHEALVALAPYQSPRLSAVAVGQVTKLTVVVKGGIPPRPLATPPKLIENKS